MAYEELGDLVAEVSGMSFAGCVDAIFYNPFACRQVRFLLGAADLRKWDLGIPKEGGVSFMLVKFYPYNRATCGIQDWIAASRTSSFLYKIATKSFVRWRKHSTHPKGYEDFFAAARFSAQYFFEAAIMRFCPPRSASV